MQHLFASADDAGALVFHADPDARSHGEVDQLAQMRRDPIDLGGVRRGGLPQERENPNQITIERLGGLDATLEDFNVFPDLGRIVDVALEDWRRAAVNFPTLALHQCGHLRDILPGQVLEGSSRHAAQFEAAQAEAADESPDVRHILGDFIRDDGEGGRKLHGETLAMMMREKVRQKFWRRSGNAQLSTINAQVGFG